MAKYKVGDKVRIVDHRTENMNPFGEMNKWLGKVMTIKDLSWFGYWMEEDYGEYMGNGWMWDDSMISGLAEPEREPCTVELRFDGMITTAVLKRGGRDVKTAEARCNPKDTYSRAEGARVAVERLFKKKRKEDKPKESKPKIGDKFVVTVAVGKYGHSFNVGDVVMLVRIFPNGNFDLVDEEGLIQMLTPSEVRPYKENAK